MNPKRSVVIPLTASLAFVLLSFFSVLVSPSSAAWKLYEPVAEVVLPTGDVNVPRAVEEKDGYVYLLAREGILYTYDISDLPLRESFTTYNAPVHKLTCSSGDGILRYGNYLYAFGRNGIQTIDAQNPAVPSLLSFRGDLRIYNMVRHENYLIAAGQGKIAVYSIDEPSNPTLLSDLNMGEGQLVWSAAAYGSTLYVCNWTSDWQGSYTNYLSMIDFSNPASLSVLNTISRDDQAYHLRVVGNQLMECTGNEVRLWDLTTPANPVFLASKQAGARVAALDGENVVTNGTVFRPDGNDLEIVATFTPGGSQRDGFPYGSAANASFVFIAQHKRILVLNASMPPLIINHASGGPGSFFTITGHGFPPNRTATFVVNNYTLGDVATNEEGDCLFLLDTTQADEGRYVVAATMDPGASTSFVIASGEPVHPQEGSGTIFQVPSGIAYATYSGGTGEPNDPYQIATAADLIALGETPEDYGKHFILTADIDLDPNLPRGKVFDRAVIAPDTNDVYGWFDGTPFTGVFDGNGHAISHLTISGGSYLGLFGQFGVGNAWAEVKNLGVVDVNITGSGSSVGGLAGYNCGGTLVRCYGTGTVGGIVSDVGGLVGYDYWGSMTECYSTGVVNGGSGVGGLVGHTSGYAAGSGSRVSQCHSAAAVRGKTDVGGLVGHNRRGAVTHSYSIGSVSGEVLVGGLVGSIDEGTVTACFWDTQTSGQTRSAGGTGKTTAEMQMAGTFLDAGWDFVGETANGTDDIWWILEGKDYPRLSWERAVWFADYMPVSPGRHGIKTFEWTYGKTGQFTSRIDGAVTVTYGDGASLTGVRITNFFDSEEGGAAGFVYNDGSAVKILGIEDRESGEHWCFSSDADLTSHSPMWFFDAVYDGMMIDQQGYYLVKQDRSASERDEGRITVCDIQDVKVLEGLYDKAVIMWDLRTDMGFTPLDWGGKDAELGIVLPTAADTRGYAVTGVWIFGRNRGFMAYADHDSDSGQLIRLAELKHVQPVP